jgi:hypothetical protein
VLLHAAAVCLAVLLSAKSGTAQQAAECGKLSETSFTVRSKVENIPTVTRPRPQTLMLKEDRLALSAGQELLYYRLLKIQINYIQPLPGCKDPVQVALRIAAHEDKRGKPVHIWVYSGISDNGEAAEKELRTIMSALTRALLRYNCIAQEQNQREASLNPDQKALVREFNVSHVDAVSYGRTLMGGLWTMGTAVPETTIHRAKLLLSNDTLTYRPREECSTKVFSVPLKDVISVSAAGNRNDEEYVVIKILLSGKKITYKFAPDGAKVVDGMRAGQFGHTYIQYTARIMQASAEARQEFSEFKAELERYINSR